MRAREGGSGREREREWPSGNEQRGGGGGGGTSKACARRCAGSAKENQVCGYVCNTCADGITVGGYSWNFDGLGCKAQFVCLRKKVYRIF